MKTPTKFYILFLLFLVIIGAFLLFFYIKETFFIPRPQSETVNIAPAKKVCIGKNCFLVQLATTQAEQEMGLMFRTTLDSDKGMLFVFDSEGIYPFWMKNTLIPLDMIWIDNNKVVYIANSAMPCPITQIVCPIISPGVKADYVLEINGGVSEKLGIGISDAVTLPVN